VSKWDQTVETVQCTPVTQSLDAILFPRRMAAAILALAGAIGLLLSSVGLYGVVCCSVAQRVRGIGIRSALGASRGDILRLVLSEVWRVLAVASAAGLALGLAAVRVTSSTVTALPALDALTFTAVPLLLAAVVLAACWIPAHRATHVNPVDVLRAE
jgi:ABC-type antimicrobial peptide transport system permease subunit